MPIDYAGIGVGLGAGIGGLLGAMKLFGRKPPKNGKVKVSFDPSTVVTKDLCDSHHETVDAQLEPLKKDVAEIKGDVKKILHNSVNRRNGD